MQKSFRIIEVDFRGKKEEVLLYRSSANTSNVYLLHVKSERVSPLLVSDFDDFCNESYVCGGNPTAAKAFIRDFSTASAVEFLERHYKEKPKSE
jgi:hypothetical protein